MPLSSTVAAAPDASSPPDSRSHHPPELPLPLLHSGRRYPCNYHHDLITNHISLMVIHRIIDMVWCFRSSRMCCQPGQYYNAAIYVGPQITLEILTCLASLALYLASAMLLLAIILSMSSRFRLVAKDLAGHLELVQGPLPLSCGMRGQPVHCINPATGTDNSVKHVKEAG